MSAIDDISESQWIQSAMGYNRNTTAFNYTQNATSIPSMQLDYSRFMDSVMTATQPTIKYPAYAASSPSSVQPTAQGAGGDSGGFLGSIENGLKKAGNYWHQMQDAYSQFKAVNPYAATQLASSNPLAATLGMDSSSIQNATNIGVAFIDGGATEVVGVGEAIAGTFTDPVGTYHKVDAWGKQLEAGANYLGDHPFKSAYAVYQLASAYVEHLSNQTATQNARELGSLVAGSAITAGIGKIAGSGLSFLVDIGSDAQKLAEFSQAGKYSVQYRTERMLAKDVGYNISPEMWFNEFDALGVSGTYVTDYRAIGEVLGPVRANQKFEVGLFSGKNRISYFKARKLEGALGLNPKTLSGGFRFTRVTNLFERAPRSPITGNEYFLGAGNGLPCGGPELVVDSVSVEPWPPIRSQP